MITIEGLVIGGKKAKLRLVQGGMAVRISLAPLASAVAIAGGVGTIALSGLKADEARQHIREAKRLIAEAYPNGDCPGFLAVNIMVALGDFKELLRAAIEEGVDIVFAGAGYSRDAFRMCAEAGVAYIPIVSQVRGAKLAENMGAPAVVLEGGKAGGHLGTDVDLFDMLSEITEAVSIPVIAGGGIMYREDVEKALCLGAVAVQVGTRFAVSVESSAHDNWKQVIVDAKEGDLTIIRTPAGMPLRAIRNLFVEEVERGKTFKELSEAFEKETCDSCLSACDKTKFCILHALERAQQGDIETGLITCGARVGEVTKIQPVQEIIDELLPPLTT